MTVEPSFEFREPPRDVREAAERAVAERERPVRTVTAAERDRFFQALREQVERAR